MLVVITSGVISFATHNTSMARNLTRRVARKLGQKGAAATKKKYGADHFSKAGKVTKRRHGLKHYSKIGKLGAKARWAKKKAAHV